MRPGGTSVRRRRLFVRLLLTNAILAPLAGCAGYPRVPCEPRVTPALGHVTEQEQTVVDVLFATDRAPTGAADPRLAFGTDRARRLPFGRAEVAIPKGHCVGCIDEGAPFAGRDPTRSVVLLSAEALDNTERDAVPERFLAGLNDRLARSPGREILIFVHGFASTFDEATRRTAQIAHDIGFDGVPIAYTWPTQGLYLSYLVDATNAEWTAPYFTHFLELLVRHSGARRIHILGHSMGTRVVARGLRDYVTLRSQPGAEASPVTADDGFPFDQVIFAAADMDADIFERDYVPAILGAARRATIYTSANDLALGLSLRLNGYDRLGQRDLPNVDRKDLERMDVVDVTPFDRDFFGHFYYSQCPRVLEDVASVLGTRAGAEAGGADDKAARRLQRTYFYRLRP